MRNIMKKTSILLFPCIVSLFITIELIRAVSVTSPRYGVESCCVAIVVSLIWLTAFIIHQVRIIKEKSARFYIECNFIVITAIASVTGLYLVNAVWGNGYLSLVPYEQLDNGAQHLDSLFHSSIAESYSRFSTPSALINAERYISYHTFSHMLIGFLSSVLRMPSFITYNFLYPVIFLPIYVFSCLFGISSAKYYFANKTTIQLIDVIVVGFFIFGFSSNLDVYGVWKTSYIASEAFCVANTLAFFSYALTFICLKKHENTKKIKLYMYIGIPIEIFLISWAKISVGFIFTAGVMYFVFRKKTKRIAYWILNVIYLGVFLLSFKLFNGSGGSGDITSQIKWQAFSEYCSGPLGINGHFIILSLMTVLFIAIEIYSNRFKWKDFINGKTIWIEAIVILSILAFLPPLIMRIPGGSAAYFSYVIEIPAMLLLCGHDYLCIENNAKGIIRPLFYSICVFLCIWTGYHNRPDDPLSYISFTHYSNTSNVLLEIRDLVDRNQKKYTVYLDEDSFLSYVFDDSRASIYAVPAMTGVGVINATYEDNGKYYSYTGDLVVDYAVSQTNNGCLSYDDAVSLAKQRGKNYIIHITNNSYEIVALT